MVHSVAAAKLAGAADAIGGFATCISLQSQSKSSVEKTGARCAFWPAAAGRSRPRLRGLAQLDLRSGSATSR
eukprot:68358-Prymnesium_polylepis.1